jgi:hypothetical protein
MIGASDLKYAICVVSEELEDSSFNKHNKDDWTEDGTKDEATKDMGLGVITIQDYKMYSPAATKLEQYLAFLILCESFCIVSRHHIEHSERKFCLFDLCHDKKDLITSIMRAFIHDQCIEDLLSFGFNEEDIAEANKILAYVRKPNTSAILLKWLNDPRISITIGALIGILINILTAKFPIISEITIIGLIVLIGVFITTQLNRSSPNKHR